MRLNFAAIASASALAAAAGWAAHGDAQQAGAPAAPGSGVTAPPPARADKSARDATTPPPSAQWTKTHAGLEAADTSDCVGCHGEEKVKHSHPVDVDYAEAARRVPAGFWPLEKVLARGVVLRGGKVGCPTCHSPTSPWAHFLAVPRELARAQPTMAELKAEQPEGAAHARTIATPPKDGAEVSSSTLCELCHVSQ
jgi:hypothetical protein